MFHRYQYEAAYYSDLSRLPLDFRRKLDICGIKLSLKDWQTFSLEERVILCHLPCETGEEIEALTRYIDFLSQRYCGRRVERIAPLNLMLWHVVAVPKAVVERSAALGPVVTIDEWRRWPSHHRYALYKTAASENQPEAFAQVLKQVRNTDT